MVHSDAINYGSVIASFQEILRALATIAPRRQGSSNACGEVSYFGRVISTTIKF